MKITQPDFYHQIQKKLFLPNQKERNKPVKIELTDDKKDNKTERGK